MVASLPLDRLLTETDGPFTMFGERPKVPSDVRQTVADMALVWNVTPATMTQTIRANLRELLEADSGD
jgi:TatD DNase family protein